MDTVALKNERGEDGLFDGIQIFILESTLYQWEPKTWSGFRRDNCLTRRKELI